MMCYYSSVLNRLLLMVAKHAPLSQESPAAAAFFYFREKEGFALKTMAFDDAYQPWLEQHIKKRKGESKRRLKDGHNHAEQEMLRNVWWPAFGHFLHLHPEYEVQDFSGGFRYIDFAYIRSNIKIAIEVDGYGPHLRNLSRRQFCDQWVRQMHLQNDNWIVIRIGYDDIEQRPRLWQQLLQQMIGRIFGDTSAQEELTASERDILRLALRLDRSLHLTDVKMTLRCGYQTARRHLHRLEQKGWLKVDGGGQQRVHSWRMDQTLRPYIM